MFYLKCLLLGLFIPIYSLLATLGCLIRFKNKSNVKFAGNFLHYYFRYLTGLRVKIINKELYNKVNNSGPYVIVANHQSAIDLGVFGYCLVRNMVGVGKKEILWVPFFGLIFFLCGNVLINRQNKRSALQTMSEALEAIRSKNVSVFMFPEGTRNKTEDDLLPFKKGAFYLAIDAQVPIVCMVSARTNHFFNSKNKIFKSGTVEVEFLEPISTVGMTRDHVDELSGLVRIKMLDALKRLKTIES